MVCSGSKMLRYGNYFVYFSVLYMWVVLAKKNLLEDITDVKDWKKVLRTRNNVLGVYISSNKDLKQLDLLQDVAEAMKGKAIIAVINCKDDKKLCKKLKVSTDSMSIKHYKDGGYNKDYDRKMTLKSMVSFLENPTADAPWEEEDTAADVVHLETPQNFAKFFSKEKRPTLVMFYAPWCGYCKRLKPEFASAASELKTEYVLAGMDVDKPENAGLRQAFNITGFPTLIYFENGKPQYKYGGESTKQGFIDWMKNPVPKLEEEEKKEEAWSDEESDVEHLTDDSFDEFLQDNPSVLIMFYAPWCGHCKKMKPEYEEAAASFKADGIEGVLAAVDATKEKVVAEKYGVKGYPAVKYFKNGQFEFDFSEGRTKDKIIQFMKDPKQPPPPEPAWEDVDSEVVHLKADDFQTYLRKKKYTLVMFYAPWCGHCKAAKPDYTKAAEALKDNSKVALAALDCTKHETVCSTQDVAGFPTFILYNYGKNPTKYNGPRAEANFISFMSDPTNPDAGTPPPPIQTTSEDMWADAPGQEHLAHLTTATFDNFIQTRAKVLIMFYAPWCGHCKNLKPAYAEAATKLVEDKKVEMALATVDATLEPQLAEKFGVKGYPTLKYFENGQYKFDFSGARSTEGILKFMDSPQERQPPLNKQPWSETSKNIHHLNADNFRTFLSERDHVLVMMHAPGCGYCQLAKPEYEAAATALAETATENKEGASRVFAAMDCSLEGNRETCLGEGLTGVPNYLYYYKGQKFGSYDGERTKDLFLNYMRDPPVKEIKVEL